MTNKERSIFDDLMNMYEFKVKTLDDGNLQLEDLQGACLGDICSEIFRDEWEIIDRMEMYHDDYIIRLLEEDFNTSFDTYGEWTDFLQTQDQDNYGYDLAILRLLTKRIQLEDLL